MGWLNINGNWIGRNRGGGVSWSSYWTTLISATVENDARDEVVLTYPTAQTSLGASDFTVAGFTISSANWVGSVLTLVLSTSVVPSDSLVVTFIRTGDTANVTNNVEIWYGIEIDETSDSPDQTRIASTVAEMTLHATLPIHSDIKACLLADTGTVNYYLNPTDWTKKVSGDASVLDGTDGMVMLEYPDFYFKVEMNTPSAGKHRIKISEYETTGFTRVFKHYVSAYEAAASRSTTKLASVVNTGTDYRGGDNTGAWDAADNSLLGMPVTKLKNEEYRSYARTRGINWDMFSYNDYTWIVWLFVIEYATLNSQKAIDTTLTAEGYKKGGLGLGVEGQTLADWNTFNAYNPFIPCGHSNALATGTGAVNYTVPGWGIIVPVNRYRGLELPFGHIWKTMQGALVEDLSAENGGTTKLYINDDHATWNGTNLMDYLVQGDVIRATNNYISKTLLGENASINGISSTGATGAKYYCDMLFSALPTSDQKRVLAQGCYSGAATGSAGLFSLIYTFSDSSNGSVSRGTRLSYRSDIGFTRLADMTYTDAQHCLVAYNSKLYRFGGINKKYESYDPVTNVWTDLGDMPIGFAGQAYRQSSIARLVGDKIYHIGGLNGSSIGNISNECWEYTPATDVWVQKTNMPTAREDFGSAVIGTKIYCFGGVINNGGASGSTNVLEIYDTATDTWDETKTDMPEPRCLGDFACTYNGKIYLIGGSNTMVGYPTLAAQTIVWEYDPVADTYTVKSPIPFGTCYKDVDEINGKLYVISGAGSGLTDFAYNHSCAIHEYDVATDTWTRKKGSPYAVLGCSSDVLNGKIYWCGGSLLSGASDAIKALIRFDTFYDAWSSYWTTLTSGLIIYRKGIRSGFYVIDYSADGGVTWELDLVKLEIDEDSIIISINDGVEGYRQVIRDGDYCIDRELTPTGFEGAEDTDWENVYIIIK